jgi:hypothetical protein
MAPASISTPARTEQDPGNSSVTLPKAADQTRPTVPPPSGSHTFCKPTHTTQNTSNPQSFADPKTPPRRQYENKLVAYYSDQRDPKHGQKLAHQESTDLRKWGPVINDVTYDLYEARPGMTVVEYIPPIDKWILVHERPIGNSSSYGVNYPVYYVLADSPLEFGKSKGLPIVINNNRAPNASPYVVWSPLGGPNGTIVVSDADRRTVYTNRFGGDVDRWEEHGTPAGAVYSRAIQIFKARPDHLMLYGGETYDNFGAGLHTPFSATVVSLRKTLGTAADAYGPP